MNARRLAATWGPTLLTALFFGFGVLAGRYTAQLPTRRAIDDYLERATLGDFVSADQRSEYASAYHDPSEAEAGMDDYAWTVPIVPAPFVGHAPAPGRHANAHINGQMLRYDTDLAVPRPVGVRRIFLTGGSTAFGSGAPDQARTIAGYLESLLDSELGAKTELRYEVVTAAYPSWTTTYERIWILQWLTQLDPDLIVSFSGNNDVHWGLNGRSTRWLQVHGDRHFQTVLTLAYEAAGRSLRDMLPPPAERIALERVVDDLVTNVDIVRRALRARGIPYVFALQPTLAVTAKALSPREEARRRKLEARRGEGSLDYFRDGYREIARSLRGAAEGESGFAFADVSDVFDRDGAETEIFLDSYHFGDRGNERIAQALLQELRPRIEGLERVGDGPGSGGP